MTPSASVTIKTDEQATTLAWHKGAFAGKNVWYDDDPYYIYYPADQYEDDLRNGVGSDVADLILNVKDALVKNGAWDITGAERTLYRSAGQDERRWVLERHRPGQGHENVSEVKAEASKFIQQYLGVELEDKKICAASCSRIHRLPSLPATRSSRIKSMSRHWPSTL